MLVGGVAGAGPIRFESKRAAAAIRANPAAAKLIDEAIALVAAEDATKKPANRSETQS